MHVGVDPRAGAGHARRLQHHRRRTRLEALRWREAAGRHRACFPQSASCSIWSLSMIDQCCRKEILAMRAQDIAGCVCRFLSYRGHVLFLQEAPVLLCDEATSALDSRTEKEILDSLLTLAEGRTSVFVAHRLSTAAQCDKIVVLENVRTGADVIMHACHEVSAQGTSNAASYGCPLHAQVQCRT